METVLLATGSPAVEDLTAYVPVVITLALGGFIAMAIVGLVAAIGTRKKSVIKAMPFEAGSVPVYTARRRMSVQFYLVALLFIVFDLETVFLFVWAPVFRELGAPGFVVMSFFLLMLVVGLVYEWKKGALEWGGHAED